MEFFLILFVLAVVLFVWFLVSVKFDEIAQEKGYTETYLWWVFFLGLVGILMVIALPDRAKVTIRDIDDNIAQKPQSGYSLRDLASKVLPKNNTAANNNEWTCKSCNSVNAASFAFCTRCGESKNKSLNQKIPGGWECKKCGKSNPNYTGTCSCGNSKYDN